MKNENGFHHFELKEDPKYPKLAGNNLRTSWWFVSWECGNR